MANQKKKAGASAATSRIDEIFDALASLGADNSVEAAVMIEKVKSAIQKAVGRMYPDCKDKDIIRVEIDPAARKFEVALMQEVVDFQPVGNTQIFIDQAKLIDPDAQIGVVIEHKLDIAMLGRTSAQTAKQSIKGDLRDISRDRILEKFGKLENDIITALVTQVDPVKKTVTLVYDKTELYLMAADQIKDEVIREGMNLKVYVTKIANKSKKPIIKLSRTHRGLVKRLFELEVPEVRDRIVEIKAISREAGARSKIAVISHDPNVDPVGTCIGPNHSRVSAVVRELGGEKIDVIQYSEDPATFIANALAPAKVKKVYILPNNDPPEFEELPDGERREKRPKVSAIAVVPFDQLSLAIGNKGQNAKLAAKLTDCKIDIKSDRDTIELPTPGAQEEPLFADAPAPAKDDLLTDDVPGTTED